MGLFSISQSLFPVIQSARSLTSNNTYWVTIDQQDLCDGELFSLLFSLGGLIVNNNLANPFLV